MGREARSRSANHSGAICVNLLRHPAADSVMTFIRQYACPYEN